MLYSDTGQPVRRLGGDYAAANQVPPDLAVPARYPLADAESAGTAPAFSAS